MIQPTAMAEAAQIDKPSPTRQRLAILVAAVPALLLAAQFAHVLVAPLAGNNRQWAVDAVVLMLLEFFMVHAGFMSLAAMAGERRWRVGIAVGLGVFYLLFVAMFAYVFDALAMAAVVAVLLAGRLGGAALGGPGEMTSRIIGSVVGVVFYLGAVTVTAGPESFPAFGFTPEVIRELRPAFGSTSGLWVEEPHRAVAGAAAYFLMLGLFELGRLLRVRST
ncbi:MAG: hypothetical protein AB7O31_17250 [Burkholderiales bacterium]